MLGLKLFVKMFAALGGKAEHDPVSFDEPLVEGVVIVGKCCDRLGRFAFRVRLYQLNQSADVLRYHKRRGRL